MANKGSRWYAAHAILYFRTHQKQREFEVWENIYLVRARSPEEARRGAAHFARVASGNDGGDLRVNGKPATLILGGIRKVVECLGDSTTFKPAAVKVVHDGM